MLDFWTVVLAVLAIVIPAAATFHVVLTKRNTSSAVAWVGLVWLAPALGVATYLLFGINRMHRRALAIRSEGRTGGPVEAIDAYPVSALEEELGAERDHVVALARLGTRVTGRPLVAGNRIDILEDGDEAFPAMLEAIGAAKESVTLCTYIFDHDPTGLEFRDALGAAASRGVEVRVLIDAVGARYSHPRMPPLLKRAGVRAALFHPELFTWRMPYFNLRNHRKILVIDGTLGFTGGMNIRQGHRVAQRPPHPVRDLHVRLEGPVVQELQRVFAEDWLTATGERLLGDRWFPRIPRAGSSIARGIPDGPDVDYEQIQMVLLGALATAKRQVRIVTPYFIPDERLLDALGVTAMRGVKVELYLPARGNLTLVQWASQAYWHLVLEKDVRIFLTGHPFDHSKIMTVDAAWAMVGSANWDPRSLQLNFEFNVETYDPELVARLDEAVDRRAAEAREISRAQMLRRPLIHRLRDGSARLLSPLL